MIFNLYLALATADDDHILEITNATTKWYCLHVLGRVLHIQSTGPRSESDHKEFYSRYSELIYANR